jgi:hypothetical protein
MAVLVDWVMAVKEQEANSNSEMTLQGCAERFR